MSYFTPPSKMQASVIRSRARTNPKMNASIRSVKDLEQVDYCDPHDPCCVKKDPEIFLDQATLTEASRTRNKCAPKNPHHFEYTILHRLKLRRLLEAAVEKQNNEELTEEQLEEIRRLEEEDDISRRPSGSMSAHGKFESPVSKNPETYPPPPPKIVTGDAERLQKSLEGLTNTALTHEIALNKDFHFKAPDRSDEDVLTRQMRITLDVKDKYWQKIDEILLTKDYKQWKNVIVELLGILKSTLIGTIPSDHAELIEKVNQEMDLRKITRYIDNDKFDLLHYVNFILDSLAGLCCPIRDKDVIELRIIPVLSQRIRRLLELMEEVNLDTSNFVLSQSRQHIIQNCIIFERNNFANYIDAQYWQRVDPLRVTRNWIRRHSIPDRPYNSMMAHAFCEVLDWKPNTEWPESLALDWNRFVPIRLEITRVTLLAVMIEAVHIYADHILGANNPDRGHSFESDQVWLLKSHRLVSVLREALDKVLTIQYIEDESKLQEGLEKCAAEAMRIVEKHSQLEHCQGMGEERSKIGEIVRSTSMNDPARLRYVEKIRDWFLEVAKGEGKKKIQTPFNLQIVGALVIVPIMGMIRLMMYNRAVFDILYKEIFDGNCGPPTKYPPASNEKKAGEGGTIILDANKYGQKDEANRDLMDENIARIVEKMREFKDRTMVYRRSKLDPRTKPMFESDGTPIVPPEMQPDYSPPQMTPLQEKHHDERLLATEPTLDADYDGLYGTGVGEPDWMFGYTTEQLLQLMERENLVNANKLRRIKERLTQETLEKRVADNLPVFHKIWGKDGGTLHKEFCRLQRILEKGSSKFPPGSTDEPSGRREFHSTCIKEAPKVEEVSNVNAKGERIIISRFGGRQFTRSKTIAKSIVPMVQKIIPDDELDMEAIARALSDVKDTDDADEYGGVTRSFDAASGAVVTENALEKLVKCLAKQNPILNILDMRIHVPRSSTKAVWNRIFGTTGTSRKSIARQRYASMMSVARQIQDTEYVSPLLARPAPSEHGRDSYQGAKSRMLGKGNLLGKSIMFSKANATQMPGTSDIPNANAQSSPTLRKKRSSTAPTKGFGVTSVVKFPMATLPRRPAPPAAVRRNSRNILNRINY